MNLVPRQINPYLKETLVFLIRFTVLAVPFYFVLWAGPDLEFAQRIYAGAGAEVLTLLNIPAESSQGVIYAEGIVLEVSKDSTGWKSVLAYLGLLFAVQSVGIRQRIYGIVFGLPILFAVNLSRIVTMVYAVQVFGVNYDFLHLFLWRWLLTIAILILWFAWLKTAVNGKNKVLYAVSHKS